MGRPVGLRVDGLGVMVSASVSKPHNIQTFCKTGSVVLHNCNTPVTRMHGDLFQYCAISLYKPKYLMTSC